MGLRIRTNIASLAAQKNLYRTKNRLDSNFRKVASGMRITQAADDAAGLAISERLKSHIRSMRQAKRNAEDGISLVQTAEGGLSELANILIRQRELSIQSASDTIGDAERQFINTEFQTLKDEIQRISRSAEYNGKKLLDGSAGYMEFQIGLHNDPLLDRVSFDATTLDSTNEALGITNVEIGTKEGAQGALSYLDDGIVHINERRAKLGAIQNRLQTVINQHEIADENFSAAHSRIRDVDMAEETANLAKNQILAQAGVSVLAQANQIPGMALKLLG